ncbi:hypothetical protein OIK40_14470 [Erythrobacter sp. sf7]|uniref:Uncharacterized protein n=1 Tax=Erythrobacter fulvus TaxID=2987523 RepID=A0ABT5JTW1_9SPHN|nr:hypothetical protein [Erythrobacter fulvus]MDC8755850.1 hypothetical protein [Erythrobacter fulvus]
MTAKRRLLPESEIRSAIELLRELGIEPGAVDLRSDGITIYPKSESQGNAFDAWKNQSNRERPARS